MSDHLILGVACLIFLHLVATALLRLIAGRAARQRDPYAEPIGDLPFSRSAGVALRTDAGGRDSHPLGEAAARTLILAAWGHL